MTLFDRYASLIVDQPHVHGPNEDHEPYRDVSPVQSPRGKSAEDVPKSASQHQWGSRGSAVATVTAVQEPAPT